MFIIDLVIFILVLGVIILIHEAGHFYFAKKAGILCHEFAIGMGPALFQKRKGETIYSIRAIPIGGYVSMAGEAVNDALIKKDQVIGIKVNEQGQIYEIHLTESLGSEFTGIVSSFDLYGKEFNPLFITLSVDGVETTYPVVRDAIYKLSEKKEMWITPSEKSFESKTLWQRFLVIFAGPMMNFILALFLFLIVGLFALKPNLDSSVVDEVRASAPADLIGLTSGDQITEINGQTINSWDDLSLVMADLNLSSTSISYTSNGNLVNVSNVPVLVAIQTAGLTNYRLDEDGNYEIFTDEAKIGQVFGRADKGEDLPDNFVITKIKVNNTEYNITNWQDIIDVFLTHKEGKVTLTYVEDDLVEKTKTYDMISERAIQMLGSESMVFQIGISPTASFDLGYSLLYPFTSFYSNTKSVFVTIGLLFDGNENIGIGDLSGPIGIFGLVSQTAKEGILAIVAFTAFLSINIGILNLLPIPALDGGRLVFLGIEAVTRKPLNRKIENSINNIMFILLMALFVFVAFNDIFG